MEINEKQLQQIRQLRLMDEALMVKCFEDNIECTELMLHLIMKKPVLQVESVRPQWRGCSVGLDILAKGTIGRQYSIKVLRGDPPAEERESRKNFPLFDDIYNPYRSTELYRIYIYEHGVVRKAISREIACFDGFSDGMLVGCIIRTIHVNGERQNRSPLGQLMFDFSYTDPSEMNYALLADRVRYLKESPEGIREMCGVLEEKWTRMHNKFCKEETTEKVTWVGGVW